MREGWNLRISLQRTTGHESLHLSLDQLMVDIYQADVMDAVTAARE